MSGPKELVDPKQDRNPGDTRSGDEWSDALSFLDQARDEAEFSDLATPEQLLALAPWTQTERDQAFERAVAQPEENLPSNVRTLRFAAIVGTTVLAAAAAIALWIRPAEPAPTLSARSASSVRNLELELVQSQLAFASALESRGADSDRERERVEMQTRRLRQAILGTTSGTAVTTRSMRGRGDEVGGESLAFAGGIHE